LALYAFFRSLGLRKETKKCGIRYARNINVSTEPAIGPRKDMLVSQMNDKGFAQYKETLGAYREIEVPSDQG
jgi:hypothetical protein